jgi:hypothetical protein
MLQTSWTTLPLDATQSKNQIECGWRVPEQHLGIHSGDLLFGQQNKRPSLYSTGRELDQLP